MPRKPRFFDADISTHIVQRGSNRQAIFFAANDYLIYLAWPKEAAEHNASFVQTRSYLLACCRSVELSPAAPPVRAGMVAAPADYPWSGYRCSARGEKDPLLTTPADYLALGSSKKKRKAAYQGPFTTELDRKLI